MSEPFRIGLGTDLHRLEPGIPLWIGGVEIPFEKGAAGHSDGDVALHALTDALLGSVAAGDIGELFPDTDSAHAGAASSTFLQKAAEILADRGYVIGNVDVVVELERPRLLPHRETICAQIAQLLGISADQVAFKAKTGEGVDAVGRGEAIAARAVVLVRRP